MPASLALSMLLLAPGRPAPQAGDLSAAKAKEAFQRLESAWSTAANGRPKLTYAGWGMVGGMVSGTTPRITWNKTLKKGQSVVYTIVGDNSVRRIKHRTIAADTNRELTVMETGEKSLFNTFTAPADGKYGFSFGVSGSLTTPAFMLLAFQSTSGHVVDRTGLAGVGEAAYTVISKGAAAGTGMIMPPNQACFFVGAFKTSGSMTISNMNMTKGPWAVVGAPEAEREGLGLSITDATGNVFARDPGEDSYAFCVLERDVPKASISLNSQSKKPRLCLVAALRAK